MHSTTPSGAPPSWLAESRRVRLLLLAVVLAVWSGALAGAFQYDDWNVVVGQPAVHSLAAWWTSMPGIRPLLKLTYALDWQAGGGAFVFHLGNLLLHAANVLLVHALVRRWPGLPAGRVDAAAFWAALLFALHPAQAEAVAYVTGRSVSLMAFFWFAAILCWLRADAAGSPRWRAAAVLSFVAALAARETALALPLLLWVWQRASGVSWSAGLRRLARLWGVFALALLVSLAVPGYRRLLGFSLDLRPPLSNLALQPDALVYLFTRPLLRLETNLDPDLVVHALGSLPWLALAALLLVFLAAGFALLRRHPLWGLAALWPFIVLLPTHSLVARIDLVADRHLYLALVGPAVAVAAAASVARWRALAVSGVAAVLAFASLQRVADFTSETALWTATAARSPGKARVWNNLGYGRLVEGDPEGAAAAFRRALAIDPQHARAAVNLERAEREAAYTAEKRR